MSQAALNGFENDNFRRRLWVDTVRNEDALGLLNCSPCLLTKSQMMSTDRISPKKYPRLAGRRSLPGTDAQTWDESQELEQARGKLPGGTHSGGWIRRTSQR